MLLYCRLQSSGLLLQACVDCATAARSAKGSSSSDRSVDVNIVYVFVCEEGHRCADRNVLFQVGLLLFDRKEMRVSHAIVSGGNRNQEILTKERERANLAVAINHLKANKK